MIKKQEDMSFVTAYVEKRTKKNTFFKNINTLIDWAPIEKEINKVYKKGEDVVGRKAYSGLLLFKMSLLQTWYNLSDPAVEEMVNDSLSASKFCGLSVEDDVPDHSVISRFRKELTEKKAYDRLLRKINKQLKNHDIIVKSGSAKIDASITETPLKPKGKTTYEVAVDRDEDNREEKDKDDEDNHQQLLKIIKPGVDTEGRWLKKGGKTVYGYKKQIAVDKEGMVLGVHTTTANEHDSKGLKPLLKKLGEKEIQDGVFTDKGYKVPDNDELLKEKGIKNRIQHKAYRNRPLTKWQIKFNKLISKQRYVVERTFGGMKRWFGAGIARYRGKAKMHTQHVMEAIAYNLFRAPGIIASKPIKA